MNKDILYQKQVESQKDEFVKLIKQINNLDLLKYLMRFTTKILERWGT